jgi:hypothetical protein
MATQINTTFPGYGAVPSDVTITPSTNGTYSLNTGSSGYYVSAASAPSPWKITNSNNATNVVISSDDNAGKIKLVGKNADIDINGVSLKDTLVKIEERLAILKPNMALEKDWEELKELGDAYRKLEAEITEKMKAWDILKEE